MFEVSRKDQCCAVSTMRTSVESGQQYVSPAFWGGRIGALGLGGSRYGGILCCYILCFLPAREAQHRPPKFPLSSRHRSEETHCHQLHPAKGKGANTPLPHVAASGR